MRRFDRPNTLKGNVPESPGVYTLYDKNRRLLYVGHAHHLRHRIQSYREKDDFDVHPTKAVLRGKVTYFAYEAMPINRAQRVEKQIKKRTMYNYL
jgi:excinuclease UvrABC nuclease subunit